MGLSLSKSIISVAVESLSPPPATIPKDLDPRWKVAQPWNPLIDFMAGPGVNVVLAKSTNQVDAEFDPSGLPPVTKPWVELIVKEQW